ncbi:thioredoxin family protein [Clostridium sp. MB40-C1]|uniref:thioredoxin family protein n=1 Tax=Clostridium sp. MB40-C1 TaxID=3070996 RepID=UPI0027DEB8A9|nr:thioredoxin family protein [Clostridium sp. MB40-C1]WMJ82152.1 thioredoxin family protein [Clostridium sp. MB40-C1]
MIKVSVIESIKNLIQDNKLVLLYIYSRQCSVCHALLPKIKFLLKKYPEIKLKVISIDDCTEVAGEFSIFTVPTVMLYINGKEYIRRARFISIEELDKSIERYYKIMFG